MTTLMMIKMIDGSNVMAEVSYDDANYIYLLNNPLIINSIQSPQGEVTTSHPYLPGSSLETLPVPSSCIITLSPVDVFFSKFYGSSLLKFYLQSVMRRLTAEGGTELDKRDVHALDLKKEELSEKYGLAKINDEEQPKIMTSNRVLH